MFQRLPRFNEPGEGGIVPGIKGAAAAEQQPAVRAHHGDDDGRIGSRVVLGAVRGATADPASGFRRRGGAAARAVGVCGVPVGDGAGLDENRGVRGVQRGRDITEPRPLRALGDAGNVGFEFLGLDLELLRQEEEDQFGSRRKVRAGQGGAQVDQLLRGVGGVLQVPGEFGGVQQHQAAAVDKGLPAGQHHGPCGAGVQELLDHPGLEPCGGAPVNQRRAYGKDSVQQLVGGQAGVRGD